jgi:hypothetical protein
LFLECASGHLRTEDLQFGVIHGESAKKNHCLPKELEKPCSVDEVQIRDYIHSTCQNARDCEIDIKKVSSFITSQDQQCRDDKGTIFVQVPCTFEQDELVTRRIEGLVIACLGVFICLFFVVFLDYLRSIFKNLYIEWDVKTITAGDYSVELEITEKMWNNFIKDIYNENLAATKLA